MEGTGGERRKESGAQDCETTRLFINQSNGSIRDICVCTFKIYVCAWKVWHCDGQEGKDQFEGFPFAISISAKV